MRLASLTKISFLRRRLARSLVSCSFVDADAVSAFALSSWDASVLWASSNECMLYGIEISKHFKELHHVNFHVSQTIQKQQIILTIWLKRRVVDYEFMGSICFEKQNMQQKRTHTYANKHTHTHTHVPISHFACSWPFFSNSCLTSRCSSAVCWRITCGDLDRNPHKYMPWTLLEQTF